MRVEGIANVSVQKEEEGNPGYRTKRRRIEIINYLEKKLQYYYGNL